MMQVPDVAPFVRALLPVHLDDGSTVTFGVWVAIHPDDLQRTARLWHEPEYEDLHLEGASATGSRPGTCSAPRSGSRSSTRTTPPTAPAAPMPT